MSDFEWPYRHWISFWEYVLVHVSCCVLLIGWSKRRASAGDGSGVDEGGAEATTQLHHHEYEPHNYGYVGVHCDVVRSAYAQVYVV